MEIKVAVHEEINGKDLRSDEAPALRTAALANVAAQLLGIPGQPAPGQVVAITPAIIDRLAHALQTVSAGIEQLRAHEHRDDLTTERHADDPLSKRADQLMTVFDAPEAPHTFAAPFTDCDRLDMWQLMLFVQKIASGYERDHAVTVEFNQ